MAVRIERFGEDRIVIVPEHQLRDRDMVKQIAGSSYDAKNYVWTAPLTWATCIAARGIFSNLLEIGPELTTWASAYKTDIFDPAMEMRLAWDAEGDPDLYPFQRAGVRFLSKIKRAALNDEMGTGKTPQTIRTLARIAAEGGNPFPAIVVAPNNMTLTWKKEFERWWPGVVVQVVKGSASQRRQQLARQDAHVWVINFESVRIHSRLESYGSIRQKRCIVCDPSLPNIPMNTRTKCEHCPKELNAHVWQTVIVDEAHRMKDPRAKQTRAIWALRTKKTEYVYGLTGTPLGDTPADLWPMLHMISRDEFPSKTKYIDRYCIASFNVFGGMTILGLRPDTKDEFFKVTDYRSRRMPKEAVLPFLPRKTYSNRFVPMLPQQKKAYDQMAAGLVAALDNGAVVASNPLVQLTRMSQFASAYAEINDQGECKLAAPSNKVNDLVELLEDMGDEPAVVFAQSRQLIELAATELLKQKISFGMIVGGQSADEREKQKDDFQGGKTRVILCTIAAGGIGITLTRSATAIFLQRSWSMIENKQAEDRVHRIGSEIHDKINIIDIISEDTLEVAQREALEGKAERLEEVMRDVLTVERMKRLKR